MSACERSDGPHCFNTTENKWQEIANKQQERSETFGIALEGKILVAGEKLKQDSISKSPSRKECEMYNTSINEW